MLTGRQSSISMCRWAFSQSFSQQSPCVKLLFIATHVSISWDFFLQQLVSERFCMLSLMPVQMVGDLRRCSASSLQAYLCWCSLFLSNLCLHGKKPGHSSICDSSEMDHSQQARLQACSSSSACSAAFSSSPSIYKACAVRARSRQACFCFLKHSHQWSL